MAIVSTGIGEQNMAYEAIIRSKKDMLLVTGDGAYNLSTDEVRKVSFRDERTFARLLKMGNFEIATEKDLIEFQEKGFPVIGKDEDVVEGPTGQQVSSPSIEDVKLDEEWIKGLEVENTNIAEEIEEAPVTTKDEEVPEDLPSKPTRRRRRKRI